LTAENRDGADFPATAEETAVAQGVDPRTHIRIESIGSEGGDDVEGGGEGNAPETDGLAADVPGETGVRSREVEAVDFPPLTEPALLPAPMFRSISAKATTC
jgi:hypothetical protein